MSDRDFDQTIRQALAKGQVVGENACPDYNAIAAYMEGRLERGERDTLEAHAAVCSTCQQVLGLASILDDAEPSRTAAESPHSRKKLLFRFAIPVSALAMLFAAVAVGVLFLRTYRPQELTQKPTQHDANQALVQAVPSPPQGISKDAKAVLPTPARPSAAANEAPKIAMKRKEALSRPAQEIPRRAAADAVAPAAILETTEISSIRTGDRRLAAAKLEPAPPTGEAAGAGQVVRAKDRGDGVAGGVVGGVMGGIDRPPQPSELQNVAASFQMAQPLPAPRDAIQESTRQQGEIDAAHWKKIGERSFRYAAGYWIDEQCAKYSDAPIMEIKKGSPEFEEIVRSYPGLRDLLPAVVFRNDKIWVLR